MLKRSGGRGLSVIVLALAGYLWFDSYQRGREAPTLLIVMLALIGVSGLFGGGRGSTESAGASGSSSADTEIN